MASTEMGRFQLKNLNWAIVFKFITFVSIFSSRCCIGISCLTKVFSSNLGQCLSRTVNIYSSFNRQVFCFLRRVLSNKIPSNNEGLRKISSHTKRNFTDISYYKIVLFSLFSYSLKLSQAFVFFSCRWQKLSTLVAALTCVPILEMATIMVGRWSLATMTSEYKLYLNYNGGSMVACDYDK